MASLAEREAAVYMRTGVRQPLTIVRGEGSRVWDDAGTEYLDFVAGIATASLGHASPVVTQALTEQASRLVQVSNIYYSEPQIDLAELLVQESGLDRVFFCSTGAEANEGAIKLARKYGRTALNGAHEIIAAQNGFHGRTLTAITASGTPRYAEPFAPLPTGFVHVPFNDVEAIRQAITPKTCAVLLEPVQGEGGVNVPDDDYLPAVRRLCDSANIALMLDEVQTGCGRTGTLFAFQRWGVSPDVMTLAKGMGGGVPIGAILANEKLSVFEPGDHGTTFGGQPLVTAVSLAVMRTIVEQDIPAQVEETGRYLREKIHSLEDRHPLVDGVRGMGLLIAIELTADDAAPLVNACRERGLLANPVRPDAVRLMPPLTVTTDEIDRALEILEDALASLETRPSA